MTNHIFPACEAMESPTRAEKDLCANALCSSSEIALILRVVVEAVCIPPCYSGMHGQANSVPVWFQYPCDSDGFNTRCPFRVCCDFFGSLLLSPWQSALILIYQFGHLRFPGCGNTHCRRDRASGCPNALGRCDQNALGWLLCFLFLCHVTTILTRVSKAGTVAGLMSG